MLGHLLIEWTFFQNKEKFYRLSTSLNGQLRLGLDSLGLKSAELSDNLRQGFAAHYRNGESLSF